MGLFFRGLCKHCDTCDSKKAKTQCEARAYTRVGFIYHRNDLQWQLREPKSFPLEFYRVSGAAQ